MQIAPVTNTGRHIRPLLFEGVVPVHFQTSGPLGLPTYRHPWTTTFDSIRGFPYPNITWLVNPGASVGRERMHYALPRCTPRYSLLYDGLPAYCLPSKLSSIIMILSFILTPVTIHFHSAHAVPFPRLHPILQVSGWIMYAQTIDWGATTQQQVLPCSSYRHILRTMPFRSHTTFVIIPCNAHRSYIMFSRFNPQSYFASITWRSLMSTFVIPVSHYLRSSVTDLIRFHPDGDFSFSLIRDFKSLLIWILTFLSITPLLFNLTLPTGTTSW